MNTASLNKEPITISSDYIVKQLDFEKTLRAKLLKAGYSELSDVKNEYLIFDLSESFWYDLGVLLWLILVLHALRRQGNEIQLVLPEQKDSRSIKLWDFLIRWRFFETLTLCVDDVVNLLKPHQIQLARRPSGYRVGTTKDFFGEETILHSLRVLEITTIKKDVDERLNDPISSFLQRFNDKIIYSALSNLCGWEKTSTEIFVQRVIREGLHNSFLHSEGSFCNISMRVDNKNLTVAISDNGVGIPNVLRNAFKSTLEFKNIIDQSDAALLKFFTEPELVLDSHYIKFSLQKGTSSQRDRGGMGLYYLKNLVLNEGGELRIRSGNASIDFCESHETPIDDLLKSPGTMIRIQTPLKTS